MLNSLFSSRQKKRLPAVQSKQRDCGLTYTYSRYVRRERNVRRLECQRVNNMLRDTGRACGWRAALQLYPPGAPRLWHMSALARQEQGAREP